MKQYGAILHTRWRAAERASDIVGEWAEDGSPYIITVPPQLRDQLVEMQNALCAKYQELDCLEIEARNYKRKCEALLPAEETE